MVIYGNSIGIFMQYHRRSKRVEENKLLRIHQVVLGCAEGRVVRITR